MTNLREKIISKMSQLNERISINEIAVPPVAEVNSEIRIVIIDENWSQYCYRIKINTPFGKLINRFCQQVRKTDHDSVLFWYHGRLVEDDDTPKTLNIKDGEVILAHYIK